MRLECFGVDLLSGCLLLPVCVQLLCCLPSHGVFLSPFTFQDRVQETDIIFVQTLELVLEADRLFELSLFGG